MDASSWLPTTAEELRMAGIDRPDVILFTGDAYVDHPAFGAALIGRYLQKHGFTVAIVPQPNWRDDLRDFTKLGPPGLFFGVTAGNMDSMVNHYTASRRLRSDDAYTPGGQAGFRPDYPTLVYTRAIRQFFPDTPVVLGGIEASLRRLTHYDYWADRLKPGFLAESGADILVYGMGEKAILAIARALKQGTQIGEVRDIPQTVVMTEQLPGGRERLIELPSYEACLKSKVVFSKAFRIIETESNRLSPATLAEKTGGKYTVVNPPYPVPTTTEMDGFYDLPFTRMPHPRYKKRGSIPAYEMIRHSVTLHRGCFGGCAFCTISAHQGKFVSSRSEDSVIREVDGITAMPDFKGYVSDLGGPSANMYRMQGRDLEKCARCIRPSCLFPSVCANLDTDHRPLVGLYMKAAARKGIKKVFVSSGIRYDLFLGRPGGEKSGRDSGEYFRQLFLHHVSGRLKVAPEHSSPEVLRVMRKPSFALFYELKRQFDALNQKFGMQQQLIPYFISGHPACTPDDMARLARETKELGFRLEQVQDFTPTPMTLASVMYYAQLDPYTLKPVYVAKTRKEKEEQHRYFFWYKPENRARTGKKPVQPAVPRKPGRGK